MASHLRYNVWDELGLDKKDAPATKTSVKRYLNIRLASSSKIQLKNLQQPDQVRCWAHDFLYGNTPRRNTSKLLSPGSRFWNPVHNKDKRLGFVWPQDTEKIIDGVEKLMREKLTDMVVFKESKSRSTSPGTDSVTDSEQAFPGQEPYASSTSHTAISPNADVPESSQKNDIQKHVSFSQQLKRPERKRKTSVAFKESTIQQQLPSTSDSPANKTKRRSSHSIRNIEDERGTTQQDEGNSAPSPELLSSNANLERFLNDYPSSEPVPNGSQSLHMQSYLLNPPNRTSSGTGTLAPAVEPESSPTTSNTARDMDEHHYNHEDGNTDGADENMSQQINGGPSAACQPSLEQATASGYSTTAFAGTPLQKRGTTTFGLANEAHSQQRHMSAGANSREQGPHQATMRSSSSQLLISSSNTNNERSTRPPWLRLWVGCPAQLDQSWRLFQRPHLMSGNTTLLADKFRSTMRILSLQAIHCDVKCDKAKGFEIVLPISREEDAEEVHQIIIERIYKLHAEEAVKNPNITIEVWMEPVELDVDIF